MRVAPLGTAKFVMSLTVVKWARSAMRVAPLGTAKFVLPLRLMSSRHLVPYDLKMCSPKRSIQGVDSTSCSWPKL